MIDCLLIGFNSSNFPDYVRMVKAMGEDSGAFKDLELAYIEHQNKPYQSMDILNHFYAEGKESHKPFHNADFVWPVITYLGSYLNRHGLTFDYVNLFQTEKELLKEKLLANEYLTIAITTTLYVSPHPVMEIVSFIRKYNKTARIVVGGPHIANSSKVADEASLQSFFKYLGGDFYVISSEGEATLVNLINAFKQGADLAAVENIAYRRGKEFVLTAQTIERSSLEENMVDYTIFPRAEFGEFISTRTAKSCPFTCSFCAFPERAGKYVYEGVEIVEHELNHIRELGGVSTVTFIDDTFNVPKGRFKEILRMMIRNGYGFRWNSTYRCDHGDEEAIELMAEAGCEGVFLGIESGSDTMLKTMNKTAKRQDYIRAIPLLSKAGISTYASLVVGFPTETYETLQETIDLVEEAKPDFFRAQLWYCDPVTPIWRQREKYGIKGSAFNWSHDTMDARTASDLIDRMFIGVENSVWLPQNGFEQWSTFYLQRKGMSLERIKTFLRSFNAAIKERLLDPGRREISPELLESLKQSCQFDKTSEPDLTPVELLSGARYLAAEEHWADVFRAETQPAEAPRPAVTKAAAEPARLDFAPERKLAESLKAQYGERLPELLLAAYGLLLARRQGTDASNVVASFEERAAGGALPVRVGAGGASDFAALLRETGRQRELGAEHGRFAFHILSSEARARVRGIRAPRFRHGFVYRHGDGAGGELARALKSYPAVAAGLALTFEAFESEGHLDLRFSYAKSEYGREECEQMAIELLALLASVAADPAAPLAELATTAVPREVAGTGPGSGVSAVS